MQKQYKRARFRHSTLWLFILAGLGVVVLMSISLSHIFDKKSSVQEEVDDYEKQIADLSSTNDDLKDIIEYLKSDDFAELEARSKLGMQKPGEVVIAVTKKAEAADVPDGDLLEVARESGEPVPTPSTQTQNHGNPYRWFVYFFGE